MRGQFFDHNRWRWNNISVIVSKILKYNANISMTKEQTASFKDKINKWIPYLYQC